MSTVGIWWKAQPCCEDHHQNIPLQYRSRHLHRSRLAEGGGSLLLGDGAVGCCHRLEPRHAYGRVCTAHEHKVHCTWCWYAKSVDRARQVWWELCQSCWHSNTQCWWHARSEDYSDYNILSTTLGHLRMRPIMRRIMPDLLTKEDILWTGQIWWQKENYARYGDRGRHIKDRPDLMTERELCQIWWQRKTY